MWAEHGSDGYAALAGPRLGLLLALVLVPAPADIDDATSQVHVLDAQGLELAAPQPRVHGCRPDRPVARIEHGKKLGRLDWIGDPVAAAAHRGASSPRVASAPSTAAVQGVDLAVGDRVLLRVNDRRADMQNGTRATITAIDAGRHTIELALQDGQAVQLDHTYLDRTTQDGEPALVHGYAATGHAAQGATVDSAFVLAGDAVYREWIYVALSRARGDTKVAVPATGPHASSRQALERLAALVERSQAQTMAIEHDRLNDVEDLLTRAIGPRPRTPAAAQAWDRALRSVTAYRQTQDTRPLEGLLGPQPDDLPARLRWLAAQHAISRAQRHGRHHELER